jgi:drug/metabolite transporter (DMT)-like permease
VLGHFVLQEKLAAAKIPWFILSLLGLVALVYGELEIKSAVGIGFGLLSALTYTLYILVSKKLFRDVPALTSVTYIQGASALLFLILSFQSVSRWNELVSQSWGLVLFFALVSTIGAMLLFLEGLKRVKGWEASILSLVEAVGGVIVSVIILDEQLKILQLIGAAVVILCLVMIAWPDREEMLRA